MNLVEKNKDTIIALCKKYKVAQLFVFGSVLSDKFQNNSDIDFIVEFQNIDLYDYADNYFDLKFSLEKLFKREVDLLEDKAITNPFLRQSINSSKQIVYG